MHWRLSPELSLSRPCLRRAGAAALRSAAAPLPRGWGCPVQLSLEPGFGYRRDVWECPWWGLPTQGWQSGISFCLPLMAAGVLGEWDTPSPPPEIGGAGLYPPTHPPSLCRSQGCALTGREQNSCSSSLGFHRICACPQQEPPTWPAHRARLCESLAEDDGGQECQKCSVWVRLLETDFSAP